MRSISSRWARAERFRRIEAPCSLQQALPAQDFMAAGDDAVKIIGDVEDGGIAVRHLRIEGEQIDRHGIGRRGKVCLIEQLDRPFGPDAPMSEQSALDAESGDGAVVGHGVGVTGPE